MLNNLVNLRLDHQEGLCGNYIGKTSCTKQWSCKIQKKRGGRKNMTPKIEREQVEEMIAIDVEAIAHKLENIPVK